VSRAHPARIHEVPAITALLAGRTCNEAVGWLAPPGSTPAGRVLERLGRGQLPLKRTASVTVVHSGLRVRALASGGRRAAGTAWEVDVLLAPEAAATGDALDTFAGEAARARALRAFLRLDIESRVLEAARTAGFMPYATEHLMMAPATAVQAPASLSLRVAADVDLHAIFRLYNRCVPQNVRAAEAVTLEEWAATQDPIGAPDAVRFVAERDGEVVAWVRTAQLGQATTFDILVDPSDGQLVKDAVAAVVALLGKGVTMRAFVPSYLEGLALELERCGFERGAEFALLSRQLAQPIRQLAPAKVAEEAAWIT
jgi:hypothetical protein